MPGSCSMRAGLACPVLPASQVQACQSASTMRIRLPEAKARTACVCPGRLFVSCSSSLRPVFWLSWKAWTWPCRSTARNRSLLMLMLVNLVFRLVLRIVGVGSPLFQV